MWVAPWESTDERLDVHRQFIDVTEKTRCWVSSSWHKERPLAYAFRHDVYSTRLHPPSVSSSLCALPFIVVRRERSIPDKNGWRSVRVIDNDQRSHRTRTQDEAQVLIAVTWPMEQSWKRRWRAHSHYRYMYRHISRSTKRSSPERHNFSHTHSIIRESEHKKILYHTDTYLPLRAFAKMHTFHN